MPRIDISLPNSEKEVAMLQCNIIFSQFFLRLIQFQLDINVPLECIKYTHLLLHDDLKRKYEAV